jgi:hypothetical protein
MYSAAIVANDEIADSCGTIISFLKTTMAGPRRNRSNRGGNREAHRSSFSARADRIDEAGS